MRLPYQCKASLHQLMRLLPKDIHDLISIYVTKHGYRTIDKQLTDLYDTHLRAISSFFDPTVCRLLEFGAGRDLLSNLYLSARGVKNQTVVDIEPHVRPQYLNHLIDQQSQLLRREDGTSIPKFSSSFREELAMLGINYSAPCDLRATAYEDGQYDAVISTSTLEHIPVPDIRRIMQELKRILVKGGVVSFIIDYRDHHSYQDATINVYNFLRFSEVAWRFYSPPRNYQNRLRHHQYKNLFMEEGFEIISTVPERSGNWEEMLDSIQCSKHFSSMSKEELSWEGAHFVIQKR